MSEITVEFNGKVYKRNPNSKYYFEYTTRNADRKKPKQLHRAVWEYYNGEIPKGWHVHHIDGNVDNNDISNLACMSAKDHLSLHAKKNAENDVYVENQKQELKRAAEKAKEWHKSEEGRKWHKQHVSESLGKANILKKHVCKMCGAEFMGYAWSKYCCLSCGDKARRRQKSHVFEPEKRACVICGGEYIAGKKNAKYCSPRCKAKGYKMMHMKGV